jgi:hypothetical protein
MPTPAKGLRRRRRAGFDNIPGELAEWFAGEPRDKHGPPWAALIYPDYALLPARWRIWKAAHPGAKPPAGWEWIDGRKPFKGHAAELAAACERRYMGSKRR